MAEDLKVNPSFEIKMESSKDGGSDHNHISPCTFTLHELAMATNNFAVDHVIGEIEAGRVYKGRLESRDRVRFFLSPSCSMDYLRVGIPPLRVCNFIRGFYVLCHSV